MEIKKLMELGFNKNEAVVYLVMIKFRKADAHEIIKETKFHKNIVYDNLNKLLDKGLITYIVEDGRKVFKLASSNMLIDFFEQKEQKINEQKKQAIDLSKEINEIAKTSTSQQDAMIYKGVKGIKTFYNETLSGGDYVVFGAPQESVKIMGEIYWKNYQLKRQEEKITARMIFNPSLRDFGKNLKNKYTKIKYFEKDFEPLTETLIQGDKVGIMVWTEEPILFLIKDKRVAENYLNFFEEMWKTATS